MPHQPIFAGPDRFGPVLEKGKVNLRTTNDVGVPSSCACWRSSIQPQGALNVGPDPERKVRWTNLVSCRHRYQVAGNVKDSPGLYHRFGYQLGCKVDELDREMNTIQKCGFRRLLRRCDPFNLSRWVRWNSRSSPSMPLYWWWSKNPPPSPLPRTLPIAWPASTEAIGLGLILQVCFSIQLPL